MKKKFLFLGPLVALLLLLPSASAASDIPASAPEFVVYIGTYTDGASKGIYGFRFQSATGKMTPLGLMAESANPSFLAVHPSRRFLYTVNETASLNGRAISAYAICPFTGKLTFLNRVASRGGAPSHLVVDKSGKCVLVANYYGGSVAVFPLKEDGRLDEASSFTQPAAQDLDKTRRDGPRPHSIYTSADNRFAIVPDQGLDQVAVYRLDHVRAVLTPADPPFIKMSRGTGPRHFAFHPNGKFGYSVNEAQSTVTVFTYDAARGALNEIQTLSTLPVGFSEKNRAAEIEVHPSGKFLYASNRGHDSVAVFAIDGVKGTLTAVEQAPAKGKTPRSFAIDPLGNYLFAANIDSDSVVLFHIDAKSGRLTATGETLQVARPACVTFVALARRPVATDAGIQSTRLLRKQY